MSKYRTIACSAMRDRPTMFLDGQYCDVIIQMNVILLVASSEDGYDYYQILSHTCRANIRVTHTNTYCVFGGGKKLLISLQM